MNLRILGSLLVVATVSSAVGDWALPRAIAQTPPAQTFQTGPWQPIARVSPDRQPDVRLINQSGLIVDYSLTTSEFSSRQLPPNGSTILTAVPLPAFILINPQNSQETLWYDISVNDESNVVTVELQRIDDAAAGYTTLNIQENGAIYAY
ncbi:MAG: hypothetical protein ACFE0J_15935 [Elainellaceae cyanobacterium]